MLIKTNEWSLFNAPFFLTNFNFLFLPIPDFVEFCNPHWGFLLLGKYRDSMV